MKDIVWIENKAYRKGYTTGSCATAAAKVAALMVLKKVIITQVSIVTPSGVKLDLDVQEPSIDGNTATAAIQKDGGDDIDVTHGMLIFAQVTLNDSAQITVDGGVGIGRVTRKGVRHEIGAAAINETPRREIEAAVREVIGAQKGADVLMQPERKVIGSCPACGSDVCETAKGWFCRDKNCKFALWKENRFFQTLGKQMTEELAKQLVNRGKARLTHCYSRKSNRYYDTTVHVETGEDGAAAFKLEFGGKK